MKTTLESLPNVAPAATAPREAERRQILALVEQFEGMLLTEMLRDVRAGDDEETDGSFGLGGSAMNDMMQSQFGSALSKAGGLGMSDMLVKAFARQAETASSGVSPGGLSAAAVPPLAVASSASSAARSTSATSLSTGPSAPASIAPPSDSASLLTLPNAAVSSRFGWRADPVDGHARFHHGTDLRMAYGTEVLAAAPGVVTSAGERPGYGLTVVVDHGDGRETRYAHLSTVDVAPGDPVAGGQPIARSGNSGRTTGPHLHFEAREYGQPVDPRLAAASWTDRKSDTRVGASDDSGVRY